MTTGVFGPILDRLRLGVPTDLLPAGRTTRSVALGALVGIGWTPCIGPVLGGILMMGASSQQALVATALLVAYSAGLAVPFLAAAVALPRLRPLMGALRRGHRYVAVVSGVFIMAIGVLILTNAFALHGEPLHPALALAGCPVSRPPTRDPRKRSGRDRRRSPPRAVVRPTTRTSCRRRPMPPPARTSGRGSWPLRSMARRPGCRLRPARPMASPPMRGARGSTAVPKTASSSMTVSTVSIAIPARGEMPSPRAGVPIDDGAQDASGKTARSASPAATAPTSCTTT